MEGRLKATLQSLVLCLLLAAACMRSAGQTTTATRAQLEFSETVFSMAVALNSCGYNDGLENSLPLRQAIRLEVQQVVQQSEEAAIAQRVFCQFQAEHRAGDTSHDIAQYVSLALDLGAPPDFAPVLPVADLPPDAAYVQGSIPLLQKFYRAAGLHAIWLKHQQQYQAEIRNQHNRVTEAITGTDLYLKLQFSAAPGTRFVIFLEPMLAPGQVNSRNYGDNYFLVVSPSTDGLRLQEVRHTYLHYVLDPLALQHTSGLKRLEPLVETIKTAPLSPAYRYDFTLLVNESLIRAIEARTLSGGKAGAPARNEYVQHSMEEGLILTRYFYEALAQFEKDSTGMKDAYGNILHDISLERETKRAHETVFASQAAPEVVVTSKPVHHESLLDAAEQKLATGDHDGAQKLALQVLSSPKNIEDLGRTYFVLARAATLAGDMQGAEAYFQKTVEGAHDPRTLAWAHIYLGRISDIQSNRTEAVEHYRAALAAGDPTPDTKAAAERGLASPYEPPSRAPR